ncbi:pentapeptide repeat-containing protein [Saccharothrix texasensis]|uniref:Pentapeptide repeat protein n=1 Tax=Saccharothrix texasensis TaxID=103734 RepID=A0A3N1HE14_9PSEU|nr:pentapeptide repeat-containing protein [Saccharothrix texasensis]ROP40751.1 pentapeptide repeat protein [Saccharothrix texasensis]
MRQDVVRTASSVLLGTGGAATFRGTGFTGAADFRDTWFRDQADFRRVRFGESVPSVRTRASASERPPGPH